MHMNLRIPIKIKFLLSAKHPVTENQSYHFYRDGINFTSFYSSSFSLHFKMYDFNSPFNTNETDQDSDFLFIFYLLTPILKWIVHCVINLHITSLNLIYACVCGIFPWG